MLAWVVILLILGPIGGALWLGFVHGDSPCILCWSQRTSMVLIALVGLFVVRYGPRPRYVGLAVILGAWGSFMGLRHSGLHLARDVGQGFAAPIFGVHTYSWSWFVHCVVLAAIGVLLLLLRGDIRSEGVRAPGRVGRVAMVLFLVATVANALQAFVTTGPPPFMGQADPVRFSLSPNRWVWMMRDELAGRISLRGSWTIPQPSPEATDPNPASGPLTDLPTLSVTGWERIGADLDGNLTDLARDSATGSFLAVTDRFGVYHLDATLTNVLHRVEIDPTYSIDLTQLAGAAFLGSDTLAVLSTNKSYVLLRPDPEADPDREWRYFRETDGGVTELRRSRFATVRARQMFVLSLAYDPDAAELITVSVPSPRHRRLVVSRFDRRDLVLASEFVPRLGAALAASGSDRALAEYLVTGAVVADGQLYALSAAYSTLLVIDLRERLVTGAYAVPGLDHPVGLAVRGGELLAAHADGRIAVFERPAPSPQSAP